MSIEDEMSDDDMILIENRTSELISENPYLVLKDFLTTDKGFKEEISISQLKFVLHFNYKTFKAMLNLYKYSSEELNQEFYNNVNFIVTNTCENVFKYLKFSEILEYDHDDEYYGDFVIDEIKYIDVHKNMLHELEETNNANFSNSIMIIKSFI